MTFSPLSHSMTRPRPGDCGNRGPAGPPFATCDSTATCLDELSPCQCTETPEVPMFTSVQMESMSGRCAAEGDLCQVNR
jgi:hypothetical protein